MAEAIRTAIDEAGLTLKVVADHFGISEQAVSGWKRTGRFDRRRVPELAELTGKPLAYFGFGPAEGLKNARGASMRAAVRGDRIKETEQRPYGLTDEEWMLIQNYRAAGTEGRKALEATGAALAEPGLIEHEAPTGS